MRNSGKFLKLDATINGIQTSQLRVLVLVLFSFVVFFVLLEKQLSVIICALSHLNLVVPWEAEGNLNS